MINFNKKDSVASAVDSILKKEEVEQIDESFEDLTPSKHGNYSVNSKVKSPKEGFHKGEHIGMDTLVHKGTIQHKDNSKPTKFEVHNHVNRGLSFQTHHSDEEKQAIKQHLVKNKYAGKGTDIHEEVEQLDELKKSTLGSYVKSAARDASASRKLGADFQNAAAKAKTDRTKASNTRLADKFNSIAQKRHVGIGKAVERLTKEDTEQVDEALKGNQHKIDKNHNNKIDAQDFKILRGKKSLKKFKEDYDENSIIDQMINEVLSKDASAGDWIHDFVHSDNPKFAGKTKAKRKEMALAAYYAKQRNEEVETVDEALKGDQHKIDKNKNKKIDAEDFKLLRKEDAVQEGWDDMVKTAQEKVKSGPKPSGGSGVKLGTRYGGGKQKEEPKEKEEVKEAKQPDQDNVPFAPPYNTSSSPANVKDKSGAVHTPMSRVKHIARQAMKKVKSNLGK